jgi:hypothetical protein
VLIPTPAIDADRVDASKMGFLFCSRECDCEYDLFCSRPWDWHLDALWKGELAANEAVARRIVAVTRGPTTLKGIFWSV